MTSIGKNFKPGQGIGDIVSFKGMSFLTGHIGRAHQKDTMRKVFLISMDAITDRLKDRIVEFLVTQNDTTI